MSNTGLLAIVLAAGKGTRMRSARPKVLHEIGGLTMLGHVLSVAAQVASDHIAVVIGPDMDAVRDEAVTRSPSTGIFVQPEQRGTADAVLAAREALQNHRGDVIVLYADTPLLTAATIARMRATLDAGAHVAVLGFKAADPSGYGRLLTDHDGSLLAIREEKDADVNEQGLGFCNSGVMAFRCQNLLSILDRIGNANWKGEYYLTDAIALARGDGLMAVAVECQEQEVIGINNREQLAVAEAIFQQRRRRQVMAEGVTLTAPETVYFSYDTTLGEDVVIEPNVFFGPGVVVEDGVAIRANCHITDTHIRTGASIGPFARLRPGADVGPNAHVGNFVEVKNTTLEAGAKANHLAYLGDGWVGAGANIGAGTIFCNYDGFFKYRTEIGPGSFVGSNSSLVAPVTIGPGAYIGSGSVIARDVPADALVLERSQLTTKSGWAAAFREKMSHRKAKAKGSS